MTPRTAARDETGASLVIALLFVTVVALVTSVVLSFSDASIRTTVQLRGQASAASTADGAAQVAINALRNGNYTNAVGQSCFGGADTLPIPNFPEPGAGSVFVECVTDETSGSPSVGSLNSANTPGNAILTLGGLDEEGFRVTSTTNTVETMRVTGGVHSNSRVDVKPAVPGDPGDALTSDTSVTATTGCVGDITPLPGCPAPTQPDPGYPAPTAATTARTVPPCPSNTGLVTFSPGRYTDAVALTACDKSNTLWFRPGTYYFDFAGTGTAKEPANTWKLDSSRLVGGTRTTDLTVPGTCVSPLTSSTPNQGVQFVFGGESQWEVGGQAKVELCGSYSATSPPIAVYGLASAVGPVPAPSGCVVDLPADGGCPLISSSDVAGDDSQMFVQGTVYAPRAWVALSYRGNGTGQFIRDGVIARSLSATLNNVDPTGVEVPVHTVGPRGAETGVLLKVYVCPGASTCSDTTGTLRLKTKVGVSNPAGSRTVEIYSWAVQR